MRQRPLLLLAVAAAAALCVTLPAIAQASVDPAGVVAPDSKASRSHTRSPSPSPSPTAPSPSPSPTGGPGYYTGDYKVSLNLYSFNLNLNASIKGRKGAPPIDVDTAVKWAKSAGFDAVDITAYYLPGYDNLTMPTVPTAQIMQNADHLKTLTQQLGIAISGTGVFNDFADPSDARRALDVKRVKFWIDVAAEMGAPVMRVFSGVVPADIDQLGWDTVTRTRIVPALQEVAAYGATKGVKIGLQNHGDMTATAAQVVQIQQWVGSANLGIIDDTGYFRPFQSTTGVGYPWYSDIAAVLPYTCSIQVKKKPGGAETDVPMDLDRLFTSVRASSYRGYIPLELLWVKTDAGYPKNLSGPPYTEISSFLGTVRASLNKTKTQRTG